MLKILHTQNNMMLCKVKPYCASIPQIKGLGCCNRQLQLHILGMFLACGPYPTIEQHKENLIISLNIHRSQGCKIGKDLIPIIKALEWFLCRVKLQFVGFLHGIKHWPMMKNMDKEAGGHVGEDEEVGSHVGEDEEVGGHVGEDEKPRGPIEFQNFEI